MRWWLGVLFGLGTLTNVNSAGAADQDPPIVIQVANETEVWNRVDAEVYDLVDRHDFRGLNKLENKFRTERAQTAGGNWKLQLYYGSVIRRAANGGEEPQEQAGEQCQATPQSFFDDWVSVDPKQPAPYIAQAFDLVGYAFCVRGTKPGAMVPPEAMKSYLAISLRAVDLLEMHRKIASVDPHYYTVMISGLLAVGASRERMQALLEEAIAREPHYHSIYEAAATFYMPRWHGRAGDEEWLARFAEANMPGGYARIFWVNLSDECRCADRGNLDWTVAKQSMWAWLRSFPSDWRAAKLGSLACKVGDQDTAIAFLNYLPSREGDWTKIPDFDRCYQSVAGRLKTAVLTEERCPYAAQENWSMEDVDRVCKGWHERSKRDSR